MKKMEKRVHFGFTRSLIRGCLLVIVLFSGMSCPTPLDEVMFNQVKDSIAPVITLTSPDDGGYYGAYTLVAGQVVDISDSGDIVIQITAEDWNGNRSEASLVLKKAEGEIAGFSVDPGNKSAVLEWQPVPGAEVYTVQELRYGTFVEGIPGSSYIRQGLDNGYLYSFRVSAEIGGSTYFSSIKNAIPLSPMTLAPRTQSRYRTINLEWADIPAASEYVVERAESRNGPFAIRAITANAFYSDTALSKTADWFYRIYPAELLNREGAIISSPIYEAPGYFPDVPTVVSTYATSG